MTKHPEFDQMVALAERLRLELDSSDCKNLVGNQIIPGKRCQLNRSMQHFVEVYWREFEILRFFLDADLTAAPLGLIPFVCNPTG